MMTLAIVLFLVAVICNTAAVYYGAVSSRYRPATTFLAVSGILKTAVIAILLMQLR